MVEIHSKDLEAPQRADEGDSDDARRMRERLVRQIETLDRPWGEVVWQPRVMAAMVKVPRHLFMPGASIAQSYRDMPYPIGHGQTISQPTIVALMSNALKLDGKEKVLEIGTGSGYQAAVLSLLCGELFSIEIVDPLGREAQARLRSMGYDNVRTRIGDGYLGWPEHAPFDRIILTAAPPTMPTALVDQLVDGGIIVAPVGDVDQELVRWTKRGGKLDKEKLGAVRFVPMVPGDPR
jgi:protein-L-isoaspartate(D-aspartate) O-methyltransferase